MRVGGMNRWLNISCIVVEKIEYVVALMLIGTNDARVERHVIGYQCVGYNPFLQTEMLWRMTRIEGMEPRFKLLAIAAGVQVLFNMIQRENR